MIFFLSTEESVFTEMITFFCNYLTVMISFLFFCTKLSWYFVRSELRHSTRVLQHYRVGGEAVDLDYVTQHALLDV